MKHIKIYENFQEGPMRKPEGFFSSLARGAKHAMGFENEEDRKSLESIHRYLNDNYLYDWVKNVREIKPGVIVAWAGDTALTVDKNAPEILFKGKVLDLNNVADEVDRLYNRLMRML
jgi:hypothetical protein